MAAPCAACRVELYADCDEEEKRALLNHELRPVGFHLDKDFKVESTLVVRRKKGGEPERRRHPPSACDSLLDEEERAAEAAIDADDAAANAGGRAVGRGGGRRRRVRGARGREAFMRAAAAKAERSRAAV